jgi:hypothetical protein
MFHPRTRSEQHIPGDRYRTVAEREHISAQIRDGQMDDAFMHRHMSREDLGVLVPAFEQNDSPSESELESLAWEIHLYVPIHRPHPVPVLTRNPSDPCTRFGTGSRINEKGSANDTCSEDPPNSGPSPRSRRDQHLKKHLLSPTRPSKSPPSLQTIPFIPRSSLDIDATNPCLESRVNIPDPVL